MGILTNRANYQDIDGILWGWQWAPNQTSGHTLLYYSFPTSSTDYGYLVSGFEPFNTAQQAAATRAIANADAVCNLDFVFTADGASGNIRFAEANWFAAGPIDWDGDGPNPAFGLVPQDGYVIPAAQGDTWFNHIYYNTPTMGSFGYFGGILHEMGHALGLKHGQDSQYVFDINGNVIYENPALPAAHDGVEYSVMTYRAYPGAPLTLAPPDEGPSTLMQDDILALQWMYGANYEYNAGNTTYKWDRATGEMSVNGVRNGVPFHNKVLMTVWDGGGVDTYDFSNFATPATVDLRPGGWSTPSRAMLADLDWRNDVTHLARGCIANAETSWGDYRGYIENARGGSGNDVLSGNALRNELRGNGGNDTLNGRAGNDTLVGGAGNDRYYADGGDTISELASAGTDTVWSSATRSLGANLENLTLIGNAAINGAGNALANVIVGNAAANLLSGGAGNDRLVGLAGNDWLMGGSGNDVLAGGAGNDIFIFNTMPSTSANRDTMADFANAAGNNDRVYLENAVFTKLGAGAAHALNPAFFRIGTAAADGNDFIVYNKATGALFYDANGSGAGGAIQFATLTTKPVLTASDFLVI